MNTEHYPDWLFTFGFSSESGPHPLGLEYGAVESPVATMKAQRGDVAFFVADADPARAWARLESLIMSAQ